MKNNNLFLNCLCETLLVFLLIASSSHLYAAPQSLIKPRPLALEKSPILLKPLAISTMGFFDLADLDSNKKLSLEEYQAFVEVKNTLILEEQFMRLDKDRDGLLRREEAPVTVKRYADERLFTKVSHLDGQPESLNLDEFQALLIMTAAFNKTITAFIKQDRNQDHQLTLDELAAVEKNAFADKKSVQSMLRSKLEKRKAMLAEFKTKITPLLNERLKRRLEKQMNNLEKSIHRLQAKLMPGAVEEALVSLMQNQEHFTQSVPAKSYEFTLVSQISFLRAVSLRISVTNNRVIKVFDLDESAPVDNTFVDDHNDILSQQSRHSMVAFTAQPTSEGVTIDTLFAELKRDQANKNLHISTQYDEKYGFPARVSINMIDPDVVDGGSFYRISDFILK